MKKLKTQSSELAIDEAEGANKIDAVQGYLELISRLSGDNSRVIHSRAHLKSGLRLKSKTGY